MSPAAVARSRGGAEARRALYENTPYVGLLAPYVLAGSFILRSAGHEIPYRFTEIYRDPVVLTILYLAVTGLFVIGRDVFVGRRRPGDPETWRFVFTRWLGTRRLVATLIVLATLPALLDVMLGYRLALTEFRPFQYDVLFARMDHALHLGRHPWEWLQPLLGHPTVTLIVDRGYTHGWFGMLWVGVIWQAVHGREPIRLQFFTSLVLAWALLGTITAILLSSAGPVYYASVTGLTDPYEPLLAYLQGVNAQTPLNAVANQERLWLTYRTWGGITAMPSMHLAITTVVALAAFRTNRTLAFVVGPVWLLMLLGSIHLGWHYAVDSYAGILGAAAIWYGSGRFARWWIGGRVDAAVASGSAVAVGEVAA